MTATLPDQPPGRVLDEAGADTQPFAALTGAAGAGRALRSAGRPGTLANRVLAVADRRRILQWVRYATASVVAGVISTVTLLVLYGFDLTSPEVASVIAYFAGAVPNYVMSRTWTWRGRGHRKPLREVVPYAAVVATTTVTAALLTGLTDEHVHLLTSLRWLQVLLVGGVFVGTYAVMFVVKFLLLDRYVFTAGKRPQ